MQQDQSPSPLRVATAGKPKHHVITAIGRPNTASGSAEETASSVSQSQSQSQQVNVYPPQAQLPNHLQHLQYRASQSSRYAPPIQTGSINSVMNNAAAAAAASWGSKSGARSFHFGGGGMAPPGPYDMDQASTSHAYRSDGNMAHLMNSSGDELGHYAPSQPISNGIIKKDPQVRLHQDPRAARTSLNHYPQMQQHNPQLQQMQPQALVGAKLPAAVTRTPSFPYSQVPPMPANFLDDDDRFSPSRIQSSMRKLAAAMNSSEVSSGSTLIADPSPLGTTEFGSSRNSSGPFTSKILSSLNRPKLPSSVTPLSFISPFGSSNSTTSAFSPTMDPIRADLAEGDRISPPEGNKSGRLAKIPGSPAAAISSNSSGGAVPRLMDQGTLTAFPASQFPASFNEGDRSTPDDKLARVEPVSPGPGHWGHPDRNSPSTSKLALGRGLLDKGKVPINVPTSSFLSVSHSRQALGDPLSRQTLASDDVGTGRSQDGISFNPNSSASRIRRSSQVLDNVLLRVGAPDSGRNSDTKLESLLASPLSSKPKSTTTGLPTDSPVGSSSTQHRVSATGSDESSHQDSRDALSHSFTGFAASEKRPVLTQAEIIKLLGGPPDSDHSKALEGYSVGQVIGEGGFCEVRIGVHHYSQRRVAIKIVDKNQLTDPNENKRMQREIRVMKHLQHESIVKLFEVVETNTFLYLVMENCPNGTLLDHVRSKKKLPEPEAAYLLQQIVSGLQHCHLREVVHRDIKLENILLGSENEMKVIDFGLSAFFLPGKMLRVHCGSPSYAAPEIVARKQYEAAPVDVWSLGIVFFAMLSGYLPFYSNTGNKQELCDKILAGKFGMPEHVSPLAADLLLRMLCVDPSKRITFDEVWEHAWIKQSPRWEPTGLIANTVKTDTTTGAVYADEQLLQVMEEAGYSRSAVLQSLLLSEFNNLTACYYLLAEVKIEEFKKQRAYGGKTSC